MRTFGMLRLQPLDDAVFLRGGDQNAVVADLLDPGFALQGFLEAPAQGLPVVARVIVGERELGLVLLHRIAIDRHPGRVGPAVGHLDEHRLEHRAELGAQLGVLEIETDDAAHGGRPGARKG